MAQSIIRGNDAVDSANIIQKDGSGNVGIGVTPSSWASPRKAIDIGTNGGIFANNVSGMSVLSNAWYDGTNYKYKLSDVATQYLQFNGIHQWISATSGTAGNNITWNAGMTLDAAGNLGIGVAPSAWYTTNFKALEIGSGSIFTNITLNDTRLYSNVYENSSGNDIYKNSHYATGYRMINGNHNWLTAPLGTAGNTITWTNAMSLDASGSLTVLGSRVTRSATQGTNLFQVDNTVNTTIAVYAISGGGFSTAETAMLTGKSTTTNRSINAAGTINASGADYAEYEYSNDINLIKGQIVGFKEDGTLTAKYSESIRFAIKSTNPSIVGGDVWGNEEILGKRPEKPVKAEEMTDEEFAELESQYEIYLADFEARLEVERQKVDRIAYAGKVPVNVYGAKAGQYVIAVDKDGSIDGKLVDKADMSFAEYQDAVGRVNKILDDGRCEVAVIIH